MSTTAEHRERIFDALDHLAGDRDVSNDDYQALLTNIAKRVSDAVAKPSLRLTISRSEDREVGRRLTFPIPASTIAAKARLAIPAEFYAEVVIDEHGKRQITRFIISPLESYAGFFGKSELSDDVELGPANRFDAAIAQEVYRWLIESYWQASNDGTWPLTIIEWEE